MSSCEISVLLDRSGSMASIRDDTVGALNAFIDDQKKVGGEATFTLVTFDTEYRPVLSRVPLKDVRPLTNDDLVPRGGTALVGALGRLVDETGRRLAALPEQDRPDRVVVVVLTDGAENSTGSTEWGRQYTRAAVMAKVKHQTDVYKWEFVFLGANQDAIKEAASYGIGASNSLNYAATGQGVQGVVRSLSANMTAYRTSAKPAGTFFDASAAAPSQGGQA